MKCLIQMTVEVVRDPVLAVLHEVVPVLALRAAVVPVRGLVRDHALSRAVLRLRPHRHGVVERVRRLLNVFGSHRRLRDPHEYISED